MSKQEVKKIFPMSYCKQEKNGRFYIFDDNTNPVFPHGHLSPRKAWKDLLKYLLTCNKDQLINEDC